MNSASIISIVIAVGVGLLITILVNVSKLINYDSYFEMKARRINLYDEFSFRLEITISAKESKVHTLTDLSLVIKKGKQVFLFATLTTEPFLTKTADGCHLEALGQHSCFILNPSSSCQAVYSFKENEGIGKEEGDVLYLCYLDEKGKGHYAVFDGDSYLDQLLNFKKRRWKIIHE